MEETQKQKRASVVPAVGCGCGLVSFAVIVWFSWLGVDAVFEYFDIGISDQQVLQEAAERCIRHVQRNHSMASGLSLTDARDENGLLAVRALPERNGIRTFFVVYAARQRNVAFFATGDGEELEAAIAAERGGELDLFTAECDYRPADHHVYSVRLRDLDVHNELPPSVLPERIISNPF